MSHQDGKEELKDSQETKKLVSQTSTGSIRNEPVPGEGEKSTPEGNVKISGGEKPGEIEYRNALQTNLLALGLCLGMFVVALDNTVIAIAIPKITTDFHSLDNTGWYGSAYMLTNCALQPMFGKFYTHFDVKWTYLSSLAVFEFGSVLCAAATNPAMLSAGRAVAGAGAAALFNGAMNIISYSVALRKRSIYIGLLAGMYSIASVVGPILDSLPAGAVTAISVVFIFSTSENKASRLTFREKLGKLDMVGIVLFISSIVCLLLALQWGGTTYSWSDSRVWGCFLGFGLIGTAFVWLQLRLGDDATIPPSIIKQRTIWSILCFELLLAIGLYFLVYYLPFYFQAVRLLSAQASGIRMIPLLVSVTIASIVSGGLTTATGHYVPLLHISAAMFTIAAGLCSTLKVDSYAGEWIGYQLLAGIGVGLSLQVGYVAAQVVLAQEQQATGVALVSFCASLGGALAVSLGNSVFLNALTDELRSRIPDSDVVEMVIRAGASNVASETPPSVLPEVIFSYNRAITRVFLIAIPMGAASLFFCLFTEWRKIDTKKKPSDEGSLDDSRAAV
ncbi:uncharacterized protein PpBr36_10748 [Pyricularia pennisetigena]|uniref:uncharacterized protein n=1 Tax=Pyricularia pennisetigena TaxID=1578925 RepID=UPI00114F21D6|nr:uncharacterized protein PpBr36_10748 [Pyricularia pennisetigena]TLS21016.1 hypothetical protein PpBr36_10748 [Pyricularia pennisetigena]